MDLNRLRAGQQLWKGGGELELKGKGTHGHDNSVVSAGGELE